MPNSATVILGVSTTPIVSPYTTYVAKFVTFMLDLEKYDHVSYVDGDRAE